MYLDLCIDYCIQLRYFRGYPDFFRIARIATVRGTAVRGYSRYPAGFKTHKYMSATELVHYDTSYLRYSQTDRQTDRHETDRQQFIFRTACTDSMRDTCAGRYIEYKLLILSIRIPHIRHMLYAVPSEIPSTPTRDGGVAAAGTDVRLPPAGSDLRPACGIGTSCPGRRQQLRT
eukprot:COSAG02_NODE_431_length_22447_cov_7.487202_7_plen_174_part_00